jgi:hypothetical protein
MIMINENHIIAPRLDLFFTEKLGSDIIINIPKCDKMLDFVFFYKKVGSGIIINIPTYDKRLDLVFFIQKSGIRHNNKYSKL